MPYLLEAKGRFRVKYIHFFLMLWQLFPMGVAMIFPALEKTLREQSRLLKEALSIEKDKGRAPQRFRSLRPCTADVVADVVEPLGGGGGTVVATLDPLQ